MEFVSCLIVLAIICNQGAARPANSDLELITKNELAVSSELSQRVSDDEIVFLIPTSITADIVITINGTLNTNKKTFTVVLPSTSGSEDCQIKYFFGNKTIVMSPAEPHYEPISYNMSLSSEEAPKFSLNLTARVDADGVEAFGMIFDGDDYGQSAPLMCKIKNFQDINQIVMKEGVADIHSLMFKFEQNN